MALVVCGGALCQCSFGSAPAALQVPPVSKVMATQAVATIMDNKPMVNVQSFGMCMSLANPQVAAATAAALGVLTPQPCLPVIAAPWAPGSPTVLIANKPALNNSSKLMCNWAGIIQINNPGQQKTMVP